MVRSEVALGALVIMLCAAAPSRSAAAENAASTPINQEDPAAHATPNAVPGGQVGPGSSAPAVGGSAGSLISKVVTPESDLVTVPANCPILVAASTSGNSLRDWGPAIGGLLGLLGALAAVYFGMKNNKAAMWQKTNEIELKDIQEKLDRFFGPYLHMSEANKLLAIEFVTRQPKEPRFALIRHIFDKRWLAGLSAGDAGLIRVICENAERLEVFIRENTGLIDKKLLEYFSRASVHFRILSLAYKGELGSDPTNFIPYMYPIQLDYVLDLEIDRLETRCKVLRSNPASPGQIPPLIIPDEEKYRLKPWPSREPSGPEKSSPEIAPIQ